MVVGESAKGIVMDKSLLIYILVGIGFFYLVTGFVNGIQGVGYSSNPTAMEPKQYQHEDSVGQLILTLSELAPNKQIEIWNISNLRAEWLALFPDFEEMKLFVDERIEGKYLQERLKALVQRVEDSYLSGDIKIEKAKHMLGVLK